MEKVYEPLSNLGGRGSWWPERRECGMLKSPLPGSQILAPDSHRGQGQAKECGLLLDHRVPAPCFVSHDPPLSNSASDSLMTTMFSFGQPSEDTHDGLSPQGLIRCAGSTVNMPEPELPRAS